MLKKISELLESIAFQSPLMAILFMAWDKEEQVLTTIGGRMEGTETLEEALYRELMEEVGLVVRKEGYPFAAWDWQSTDTYTVWLLAKVNHFVLHDFENEKTGYVIFNFETARQMIAQLEKDSQDRIEILSIAEERANQLV